MMGFNKDNLPSMKPCVKRPVWVEAVQIDDDFFVESGRQRYHGQKGDYLIRSITGELGVSSRKVFESGYDFFGGTFDMTNDAPYGDNLKKICDSVEALMEARREVYRKFLAPWNIEKGENLRKQDERLASLFRQLKTMMGDVHDLYKDAQQRQLDGYRTIGEQAGEITNLRNKLQIATKEYETLHESYDQLVHQLESVSALQAEVESLKAQLAEAANGKSPSKKRKK